MYCTLSKRRVLWTMSMQVFSLTLCPPRMQVYCMWFRIQAFKAFLCDLELLFTDARYHGNEIYVIYSRYFDDCTLHTPSCTLSYSQILPMRCRDGWLQLMLPSRARLVRPRRGSRKCSWDLSTKRLVSPHLYSHFHTPHTPRLSCLVLHVRNSVRYCLIVRYRLEH